MTNCSDPRLVKRLSAFASGVAIFSAAVGLSGLAAWTLHIPSLTTWGAAPATMKANTAVCLMLIGVSLWLLRNKQHQPFVRARRFTANTLASLVGLVGLLSLGEQLFRWNLGIDQFLLVAPPTMETVNVRAGLMSPATASAFVLLALALLGIDWRTRQGWWPAQLLSILAGVVATFGILTFALDPHIYASHLSLALPTAVTLVVFSVGLVCSRTDWGMGALLCSQSLGGNLARRLFPATFIPVLVGWIRWRVTATGLYSEWSIVVLASMITMSMLAGLIAWAAVVVDRNDVERRKTEEAREHLAAVVDSSDDAIISKDLNGTIHAWNRGAEKIFGYPASEAAGKPMLMIFPPDRVAEESDILARIRHGDSVEHFETVRVRKDGRRIDLSVTISPIRDNSGAIVGASNIARDISERKRAAEALGAQALELSRYAEELSASQEALQRQTLMLQSVLDSMSEGLVVADESGKFIIWNPAAEKIVGLGADSVPSEEWSAHYGLFLPDTVTPFPPAQNPLLRAIHGEVCSAEMFLRNPELAEGVWVEASASPLKDKNGVARGGVTAFRDISQRKRDEREIRKLNDELEHRVLERTAQLEAANKELADQKFAVDQHAIVAVTDIHGTITYVNDRFCAISGYSREELIGQNHRIMKSDQHPPGFFESMYRTIANGKVWRGEVQNCAKDGSVFWLDSTIVPFVGTDGKPWQYVAIRADITQLKQAEARDRQRTAELEAANYELDAFSYSVSHDLRAPLRHIGGFSELLLEEYGASLQPTAKRYLDRIQSGTQKMGQLVDELLNLARVGRQALSLRPTRLNPIVEDVVAILQPESEGRQVEWVIAELPEVECDPVLIKQVFQNFLANALKFTRSRIPAIIEVGYKEEDGQPVFMVRDNGIGFNMKYVDKLFGVFQRLHRAEDFEGTGIGLATVQRIVQKHGGRVWAEGEVDKGATFYFTLSAGEQAEPKGNAATAGGKS